MEATHKIRQTEGTCRSDVKVGRKNVNTDERAILMNIGGSSPTFGVL